VTGAVGELLESNIQRSAAAYENNPAEERAKYQYDVDKDMMLVKITDLNGNALGSINWFRTRRHAQTRRFAHTARPYADRRSGVPPRFPPRRTRPPPPTAVHATSMNNTNRLISSDNKGYAAIRMERDFNGGPGAFPGKGPFVAAFSTANQGDVSPNTKGAFCNEGPNAGQPCDKLTSTCPNDRGINLVQLCTAQGPAGKNDRENTRIIGENQYRKAIELFINATQHLGGRLRYRQSFVNMTHLVVEVNGYNYTTCKPAMGYSFAGGTTDGPGFFNFHQGDSDPEHPFWDRIRDFLVEPSESERQCQLPKPILLPTGEAVLPHAWQPDIVDIQLVVLGDLVIIAVPGEFSTMAGRRLRDHVRQILTDGGVISANAIVTIAGLSNTYTNYIVTYEEYLVQRYEGASTIYGPHTLSAYLQEYGKLARAIVDNVAVPAGPSPPDFYDRLISQAPVPREDTQPDGAAFGAVKRGACRVYRAAVG